jgi:sn-glycerol 3-phosphate transport system ATP-binding protein
MGRPLDIYEKPATTFVATFIGAPPMNLLKLSAQEFSTLVAGGKAPAEGVILGVRPEDFEIAPAAPAGGLTLPLTVDAAERVGPESFVYGTMGRGGDVIVRTPGQAVPPIGTKITAVARREKLHVFSVDGATRLDF